MRKLSTATLAAAVSLVFASATQAATAGTSVIPNVQSAPTLSQPVATAPASTSGTSTSTTSTSSMTRAPSVNSDVRAQQTNAAVAGTHASGSTSAIAGLLGTTSSISTTGTGTTAGTGTTSGTGTGTTSGLGATGTNSVAAIGALNGGTAFGGGAAILNNPADFTNGAVAGNGMTYAANDVVGGAAMIDTTTAASATLPNGANVDRAIREVSKDRRRIGRNGQLLYTIAPRTNVDRSNEMRDDPLPFSLTGSNSTLTR
jgi:hypothetical protein